jgi:hypothetical protein
MRTVMLGIETQNDLTRRFLATAPADHNQARRAPCGYQENSRSKAQAPRLNDL